MSRLLPAALGLLASLALAGCERPGEDECRKAVENIRRLSRTEGSEFGTDPSAAIRSCRANASVQSVQCMITAKSQADLEACEGGIARGNAKPSAPASK